MGETQNRSGQDGEEKNPISAHAGYRTPAVQPIDYSLYRLSSPDSLLHFFMHCIRVAVTLIYQ